MCKFYNSIVTTISDYERFLFLTLLDDLEETINPGIDKITWASESFEKFLADCTEILTRVRKKTPTWSFHMH